MEIKNVRTILEKDYYGDIAEKYFAVLGEYLNSGWKMKRIYGGWVAYLDDAQYEAWKQEQEGGR